MNTHILKKRIPVVLIIIILAFTVVGVSRRCSNNSSTLSGAFVRPQSDTLVVGIEMSPLTYTLRHDTASGLDYQIIQAIAQQHGLATSFVAISDLESAFRRLDNGDFDLLVASIPSTTNLQKYFAITDPVYTDKLVLVQSPDTITHRHIDAQEHLIGDTVWIVEGSPVQTRLKNMARELGDTIHIATRSGHSAEHLAILTALGQIPRAVVSQSVAQRIATDYPNLDISTPVSLSHFQCWVVAPSDTILRDSLNTWLNQYKQTTQYQSFLHQYLE